MLRASLEGSIALITGASSGIGEATARELAAQGAAVVLVARRGSRLRSIADCIASAGGIALAVEADLTDYEQAAKAVNRAASEFGRLDIVVNNAGLMLVGPVADAPPDEWRRMMDINVDAVLGITRAALPHLVDAAETSPRGVADIVNISSTAGRVARAGTAVYNLTKFGVNAFSESLRQEMQPKRVRVGVIEPGTVDTELSSHVRDGVREGIETQVSEMELLRPADIADAVTYMVSRPRRVAVNEILVRAGEQTW